MLSVLPGVRPETGDPPPLLDFDEQTLLNVPDLWQRSKLADEVAAQLAAAAAVARRIRAEAVRDLINVHGAKQHQVARHLRRSRQRIHQMVGNLPSNLSSVGAEA